VFQKARDDFKKGMEIAADIDGCRPRLVAFFYMIASPERKKVFAQNVQVVKALNAK
jgi:hypothetical protein